MGILTSAELVAAVSNAGGLGILGTLGRPNPVEDLRDHLQRLKQLTNRAFGVNYVVTSYTEDSFALALDSKVKLISTALGDPGNLVKRAHDAGALLMHQVHTRKQAVQAKERGVDIIVAQGSEAGGEGQWVSALPLIPQVVDAVKPIPVLAAGGIADGRGVAAALILGAQGVVMGTRFLASVEAPIAADYKEMIIRSESEDTLQIPFNEVFPPRALGYGTVMRALRTDFIDKWDKNKEEVRRNAEKLRDEITQALIRGKLHEFIPVMGQTNGLIRDILPVAEIVKRLVDETRNILDQAVRIGT